MNKYRFNGLSKEQEKIAIDLYENNYRCYGNYTLEEVDSDMLDSWIDTVVEEGDEEYEFFLKEAKKKNAEVFTLNDNLGDFSQPIGEVVVY